MAGLESELNAACGSARAGSISRSGSSAGRSEAVSPFPAARRHEAVVVVASVSDGAHTGRGECVPYARYGESVEGVAAAIEACARPIANGLSRAGLAALLPAGAARNALDCALWDLEAKRSGRSAAALGRDRLAFTRCSRPSRFRLRPPRRWRQGRARRALIPCSSSSSAERATRSGSLAVREAVPQARLIADANEAWQPHETESLLAIAAAVCVELIEQPLPAGNDDLLQHIEQTRSGLRRRVGP